MPGSYGWDIENSHNTVVLAVDFEAALLLVLLCRYLLVIRIVKSWLVNRAAESQHGPQENVGWRALISIDVGQTLCRILLECDYR